MKAASRRLKKAYPAAAGAAAAAASACEISGVALVDALAAAAPPTTAPLRKPRRSNSWAVMIASLPPGRTTRGRYFGCEHAAFGSFRQDDCRMTGLQVDWNAPAEILCAATALNVSGGCSSSSR